MASCWAALRTLAILVGVFVGLLILTAIASGVVHAFLYTFEAGCLALALFRRSSAPDDLLETETLPIARLNQPLIQYRGGDRPIVCLRMTTPTGLIPRPNQSRGQLLLEALHPTVM